MFEEIRLPYGVPFYAQISSPELAGRIFNEGLNPEMDPNWHKSGAVTPQEYAYWVMRACGIVCVKMCIEALGGTARSLMYWINKGLAKDGYLITRQDGQVIEKGWIHSVLAELIAEEGYAAKAQAASMDDIVEFLRQGCLLIASVSYQLGTTNPITEKGGHLVILIGVDLLDGIPRTIFINNPSGRTLALQENAAIPVERFAASFTGRVIAVSKLKSETTQE